MKKLIIITALLFLATPVFAGERRGYLEDTNRDSAKDTYIRQYDTSNDYNTRQQETVKPHSHDKPTYGRSLLNDEKPKLGRSLLNDD